MKIRVLIIDDEALARARIRRLLAQAPDFEVVGECSNGPDAIAAIDALRPQLVFLDVQMPEVSGFDVLRQLPADRIPAVIFVTAHDQHAIEAFDVHALDYLLKPVRPARFQEAIEQARRRLQAPAEEIANPRLMEWLNSVPRPSQYLSRIPVKSGDRTLFVKVEELNYIESAANYLVLHTAGGNHILRETLTHIEAKLPPNRFLRVSRSVIVNLDRVTELHPALKGEYSVVLKDGTTLPMTRGVREIQDRLQYL